LEHQRLHSTAAAADDALLDDALKSLSVRTIGSGDLD
jgi:hypothetical protein